jgi:TatD DNase family protein
LFTRKYLAVGEIGMDLYWDKTFQDAQAQAFRQQISWAKELKLPIIIHAREAFEEIFDIVDELNDDSLRGIFHCFTGTLEQAQKIQEYGGFMLGLGGVLTYKKSGLDEVVKDIPLDMIVLETDSPYLPPTPHRGKRNESAYLIHIAEKLAEIKQMKLTEVADLTTANARQMFNLN